MHPELKVLIDLLEAPASCAAKLEQIEAQAEKLKTLDVNMDHALLVAASKKNHELAVFALCWAGANPNYLSPENCPLLKNEDVSWMRDTTPLMVAALSGNVQTIDMLIICGAKVNAETIHYQRTALNYAAMAGELKAVKHLVKAGADVSHKCAVIEDGVLSHFTSLELAQLNKKKPGVADYLALQPAPAKVSHLSSFKKEPQVSTTDAVIEEYTHTVG